MRKFCKFGKLAINKSEPNDVISIKANQYSMIETTSITF